MVKVTEIDTPEEKAMGGAFDAADRTSRELGRWRPVVRAADADLIPDKGVIDARANDIMRNDAYVRSGAALHKDNIVGAQFRLSAKPNYRALGLDETWAGEFQQEVETKFHLWAESLSCWPDVEGKNDFTALVRLAIGVYVAAGEVLASAEWLRDTDRPYHTAIKMIETARLSNPLDRSFDQERVRGGVQFNSQGRPLGYYLRRQLPGGISNLGQVHRWSYVRARTRFGRPQVIHLFEQTRPGESRGVSQMVAALKEMRTTKKFRDILLQNAVVQASYAATIESELPTADIFASLGGQQSQTPADAALDYASQMLAGIEAYAGGAKNLNIDGAKIPHLLPGTKFNLKPMGSPGGVGPGYESSLLRYIAANLGVSYEQLSKDYSETNYSSARAGLVETWRSMMSRKRAVADRFAGLVYRLWFEEALNAGHFSTVPSSAPNFYEGLNMEAYVGAQWIGAARGQIDELKETQASRLRLDSGLSTFEDELAAQGKDWRDVFAQRKREKDLMDELGIEMAPSDAANAATGETRDGTAGGSDV